MKKQKNLIKLADMIWEAICNRKKRHLQLLQSNLEDFCKKCSDTSKDSHLFHTAVERNWSGAVEKMKSRISRNLNDFSYHLLRFKELVNADRGKQAKLSDIFAEFNQIEQDIGELQFNLEEKTISVITEPISLEEISLGSFEIKLNMNEMCMLCTDSPYKIIALEPNPAGGDSSVTHPHVSGEKLCEGDGYTIIRRALEDGRLCDFFTMVVNILQTYNPDSPYVSLDDWEGESCYDCGRTVSNGESYYCEDCGREYCESCSNCCQTCDVTTCLGCGGECDSCHDFICSSCSRKCIQCGETVCKDCIDEELCPNCISERDNYEEIKEEQEQQLQASVAVQPDSVGETAVHA